MAIDTPAPTSAATSRNTSQATSPGRAPGVQYHLLSHSTMAPSVVDPKLIEELSGVLLDKSPVKLPSVSTHPEGRILSPLIGMETGSVRMAKQIMPGKGELLTTIKQPHWKFLRPDNGDLPDGWEAADPGGPPPLRVLPVSGN